MGPIGWQEWQRRQEKEKEWERRQERDLEGQLRFAVARRSNP